MKTRIFTLAAIGMMLMAVSCSKSMQTSLDEENLPVKIKVTGHVRYLATEDDGTPSDPAVVEAGTSVNIMYGIPDADGNVEFALMAVETDGSGYFESQIGCPVGKTMKVKASSSYLSESYALDREGDYVSTDTYFFAEIEKSVLCGETVYYALDLTASACTSEDGLTQPK